MDGVPTDGPTAERTVSRPQQAIHDYNARMRKWRIGYAVLVAVVVIAAGVIVKIAYAHGEISHAKLSTAPNAAPSVPLTAPSATLTRAWSSPDHTAIGTPYSGGTVVTYSTHAVVGRDALTGKVRWSYTRSDRTTCTAAQLSNVTIAVFSVHGNCDELTALDSGTGARRWTRTLDKDGHPVDGRPQFSATEDTFMVTTPQVIYAISPDGTSDQGDGGLDRWVFSEQGCTIHSAVLGTTGALISQTCATPDCAGVKFCGAGQQLLLRDPFAGDNSDSSKNNGNPDQIIWNLIGNTMTPVSADGVISALNTQTGALTTFDAKKGQQLAALPLAAPASGAPAAISTGSAELIRLDGVTYSVNIAGTKIEWHTDTAALPTVTAGVGTLSGKLVVPTSDGAAALDPATGDVAHRYSVPAPAAGSQVYAFGSGLLVTGPQTAVYQ